MGLFGDSDGSCAINLSLPERAVERAHYEATYSGRRQASQGAEAPISVSVQYEGDELDDDDVAQVEDWLTGLLYDEIGSRHF
ncbi:hypothetical protein [Halosimplex marinum]|uniref:hypothetical protein n=1 Tax=Halosimplex marinum TaxID=3396620 RepID=UPI003F56675D